MNVSRDLKFSSKYIYIHVLGIEFPRGWCTRKCICELSSFLELWQLAVSFLLQQISQFPYFARRNSKRGCCCGRHENAKHTIFTHTYSILNDDLSFLAQSLYHSFEACVAQSALINHIYKCRTSEQHLFKNLFIYIYIVNLEFTLLWCQNYQPCIFLLENFIFPRKEREKKTKFLPVRWFFSRNFFSLIFLM